MNQLLLYVAIPFFLYGAYWDYKSRIIPDIVPAFLIIIAILQYATCEVQTMEMNERMLGVAVPAIVLFALFLIDNEGLGGGDYKLIIAAGALLGLSVLLNLLFLACLMSLLYCIIKKARTIPFAVPMSAAYLIVVIVKG